MGLVFCLQIMLIICWEEKTYQSLGPVCLSSLKVIYWLQYYSTKLWQGPMNLSKLPDKVMVAILLNPICYSKGLFVCPKCLRKMSFFAVTKVLNIGYRDHIGWGLSISSIRYRISGKISGIRTHIERSYWTVYNGCICHLLPLFKHSHASLSEGTHEQGKVSKCELCGCEFLMACLVISISLVRNLA